MHLQVESALKQGTKILMGGKTYVVVACIDLNWLYDDDTINRFVINIKETYL